MSEIEGEFYVRKKWKNKNIIVSSKLIIIYNNKRNAFLKLLYNKKENCILQSSYILDNKYNYKLIKINHMNFLIINIIIKNFK